MRLALIAVGYALVLVGAGAIPPVQPNLISVCYFVGGWLALFLVAAVTAFNLAPPGRMGCGVRSGGLCGLWRGNNRPVDNRGAAA